MILFASGFHDLSKRTRFEIKEKSENDPILPNKIEKELNLQSMTENKIKLKKRSSNFPSGKKIYFWKVFIFVFLENFSFSKKMYC